MLSPMPSAAEIANDFRRFLADQDLPPERRRTAEAAIDAFLAFDAQNNPASLELLVAAIRSPHKAVREIGAQLLAALAGPFEAAQARWRVLAADRSVNARFHAMAYLDERMPEQLCLDVLRRGLSDTSERVRQKAVEVSEGLGQRALVAELEALLARETSASVKASLVFHLPILRDGYAVESQDAQSHWVSFRLPGALVSAPLFGEATPEAIRALIAEETTKRSGV